MLYITTRDHNDAYTAHRVLCENRAADGGMFLPMQMPKVSDEQISDLQNKTFGQNVADILNLFYKSRLDGWDIDFCIGRYSSKLTAMSHRACIAEVWHNPDHDFARVVRNLTSRLRGNKDTTDAPTNWAWISIRIAMLFAMFGEMYKMHTASPDTVVDVAIPSGDFAGPMAVWYARQMGLPVGNIICACDENDAAWELLKNGQINMTAGMTIPTDLERLIYGVLGLEESKRFADLMDQRRSYSVSEEAATSLKRGMYPAVISWKRRSEIIRGVYSASTYILDPGSAMAFGGLQDYRALAGETRPALIITERGPICSADTVSSAMGITVEMLRQRLNLD